jgi:hypothetical protein
MAKVGADIRKGDTDDTSVVTVKEAAKCSLGVDKRQIEKISLR